MADAYDFETERVRVRAVLLQLSDATLSAAVDAWLAEHPRRELAVFIEGDERGPREVMAGSRAMVAARLRLIANKDKGPAELAKLLLNAPYDHLFPCAFATWLPGGSCDVSVIMMRMHTEN